jgi:hypothetical protein
MRAQPCLTCVVEGERESNAALNALGSTVVSTGNSWPGKLYDVS